MSAALAIPFDASRGCPQSATLDLGRRRFTFTLVATVADLAALGSVDVTSLLLDSNAAGRVAHVPADAGELFVQPPFSTLSPEIVRPMLVVREGATVLGARSLVTNTVLHYGTTESSAAALDVVVTELRLAASALIRPGDVGNVIRAQAELRTAGVDRFESPPLTKEDPYGELS